MKLIKNVKEAIKKIKEVAIEKKWQIMSLLLGTVTTCPMLAYGAGGADAKWKAVIDFITPWISRFGGLVILIGAVEFGLAFKSDDAEGKTRGIRTIVAGCIVFAVGLSTSTFL